MAKFSMDDYIDVAERIMHFKEAHPDGTLQTLGWTVQQVGERTFIVYQAAAYRTPDDPRPGHGIAWEPFPGPTPYTKDSELMNAETAAWGRAIVACGLAANRKIASRQEVKARQAPTPIAPKPVLPDSEVNELREMYAATGWSEENLRLHLVAVGCADASDLRRAIPSLSLGQARELRSAMSAALDAAA